MLVICGGCGLKCWATIHPGRSLDRAPPSPGPEHAIPCISESSRLQKTQAFSERTIRDNVCEPCPTDGQRNNLPLPRARPSGALGE